MHHFSNLLSTYDSDTQTSSKNLGLDKKITSVNEKKTISPHRRHVLNRCGLLLQSSWRGVVYRVGQKKRCHRLMTIILSILNRFKILFTERFLGKFAVKWILKIPPHLAYVATLPSKTSP